MYSREEKNQYQALLQYFSPNPGTYQDQQSPAFLSPKDFINGTYEPEDISIQPFMSNFLILILEYLYRILNVMK